MSLPCHAARNKAKYVAQVLPERNGPHQNFQLHLKQQDTTTTFHSNPPQHAGTVTNLRRTVPASDMSVELKVGALPLPRVGGKKSMLSMYVSRRKLPSFRACFMPFSVSCDQPLNAMPRATSVVVQGEGRGTRNRQCRESAPWAHLDQNEAAHSPSVQLLYSVRE